MISLKHISTLSVFNQTKFSADSTDSSYFLGSDQTQIFQGTPDVRYNDLCYIKCSNLQYTHGHLYGSTEVGEAHVSLTQEEYDALSEEEKNNGKIYLIKESTIPDLIDQLPLATTTSNGLMSAGDKAKLNSLNTLNVQWSYGTTRTGIRQTKDVDYFGCDVPPAISGYVKIDRYVEIINGGDQIAAACPAYSGLSGSGLVNVITKLVEGIDSATFSLRVVDVYIKY